MKKSIAIIGGGPSALSLACFLDPDKYQVTIYEKNKATGRKFLVAGKGGFNLSHSEEPPNFINKYTPPSFLKEAFNHFDNKQFRKWLTQIGIQTYIGSSKKIFPEKGTKPIDVLNAILQQLEDRKTKILFGYNWMGWKDQSPLFENKELINSDITVFALGGGSWKITGSDGGWTNYFESKNIKTNPFQAVNCAYEVKWSSDFLKSYEGTPLKNIAVNCDGKQQKGELVITKFGLEGNGIYALSPQIQKQFTIAKQATVFLDLKPTLTVQKIESVLQTSNEKNLSSKLRNSLKLQGNQVALLKHFTTKEEFIDAKILSEKIKALPILLSATAPLDEAISTTGGIPLEAVNQYFELKNLPNNYCLGEMLDWNAPTGGYLLQACFSMGAYLAHHLNSK